VLRGGRTVATLATAETTPRALATLMVGHELTPARGGRAPASGGPLLELSDIRVAASRGGDAVRGVSLVVGAGEIVGVAGVAGNGQRELAEAIAGLRAPTAGTVRVGGVAIRRGDPRAALDAGIAFVPEDRVGTGSAPGLSVASNLVLRSYRQRSLSTGPFLLLDRIRVSALELIGRYRIQVPGPETPARVLSGGNLQKVVIAREFSGSPRVVVAASPTQGLDVGAADTVRSHLRAAAARGVAVLVFSEDLEEILELADRVAVMYEGAIAGEVPASRASIEELGLMMAGGAAHAAAEDPADG
jgi:simple sugar transport system ATP-binding protein